MEFPRKFPLEFQPELLFIRRSLGLQLFGWLQIINRVCAKISCRPCRAFLEVELVAQVAQVARLQPLLQRLVRKN